MQGTINFLGIFILILILGACQEQEETVALESSTYTMHRANFNPSQGEVIVTELSPSSLLIEIELNNTDSQGSHPAHLHFGSVREVGELAFSLNPVNGETGKSSTTLDKVILSNGEMLTYDRFLELDGSIKVHMNDNFFKHMVLSYANVGKNEQYFFDGVAVCTGH
ncbi:MAG: hypothetical protein JXR10_04540 [Cyclobacteriaceae bacterium]